MATRAVLLLILMIVVQEAGLVLIQVVVGTLVGGILQQPVVQVAD